MELLVENKSIAVPGEVLAKGMEYLPTNGTYRGRGIVYLLPVSESLTLTAALSGLLLFQAGIFRKGAT